MAQSRNPASKPTAASKTKLGAAALVGASLLFSSLSASAETWGDTAIGYRYGTKFAEPFASNDIHKSILNLTHVGGYKYGTNFFNADLLLSDNKDPDAAGNGAQEVYIVYRNTVDLSKVTGTEYKFGIVKGVGVTFGFDANTKNDAGYASKKRMFVLGPTLMIDVPGFLNIDLLAFHESNAPVGSPVGRYTYDVHAALGAAWGIPIGTLPLSFEGFALYIASKGKDEFGGDTKPETNIDMQLMADIGAIVGGAPKTFKAGIEYQYWRNKFGNDHKGAAGNGAFAKTPMVRVEYHF